MVSVDGVLSRPRKGWTCFTQALPQTGGASIHGDSGKKRATIELKGRPGDVPWVVQLSDLHLSVHHPKRALDFKAILGPTLAMVKPSLVFITGDLTDGKSKDLLTMKQDEAGWVEYHKVIDDAIKRSGLKRSSFYDLRGNHDSFGVPNTDGSFDFYSKYSINAQLGRRGSISSVTVQMIWSAFKPTRSFGNNLTTDELKLTMEDGARLWKIDCGSICVFVAVPLSPSAMYVYHAAGIAKHGEIDYEAVVNLAEGFNGADLRNVCTETGMSAIRAERDYVIHEDFMKVVRKLNGAKKLESSAQYNADFGKV